MALPSTLTQHKQGFTLIEVLIAMVILTVIVGFGLFISFDFYKSYSFRAEKNIIVSVLQKARSQSLNNINQTRHGVRFENNSGLKYIIFECPGAKPQCKSRKEDFATDIAIDSSWGIFISSPTLPFNVVFDQLNGSCVTSFNFDCSPINPITVSDGTKSYYISINSEGRIDWQ